MPAALSHVLSIVVGLFTIALVWYYRLAVTPRVSAEEVQRMPAYLRPGTPTVWITTIVVTVLLGLTVLFAFFLLLTGDPEDYGSNTSTILFVLLDLLLIGVILRIRRRAARSAQPSDS
jgi:ABC-type Na+ efflux pump permease subunit